MTNLNKEIASFIQLFTRKGLLKRKNNTGRPPILDEINLGVHIWTPKWPLVGFLRNFLALF
jgi:hypothetical protein